MLKGMYVFAEEKVGLEAFGLVYVPEKGAYYGLPEDFDEAAKTEDYIREAIERGDVEYV
jgi:hypothetical protein